MPDHEHLTNKIVRIFLDSNLSLILILLATILGFAALWLTPREEDPQIVVPLADIYVNFPGHSVAEVEQLIATPLEKILYQIDGVEFVYSMSREAPQTTPSHKDTVIIVITDRNSRATAGPSRFESTPASFRPRQPVDIDNFGVIA